MPTTTADTAELLQAGSHDRYTVSFSPRNHDWIEIRSERQLADGAADLDFLRLVNDDGLWRIYHLTHNEVLKGEATLSHSFVGHLYGIVADFFETL